MYPHRAGTQAHVCICMHTRAKEKEGGGEEEEEKNRRQRHVCGGQKNRERIQPGCDARVQLLSRMTRWYEASSYVDTATCTGSDDMLGKQCSVARTAAF